MIKYTCPKCGSPDLIFIGSYQLGIPQLTNNKMECKKCGYTSKIERFVHIIPIEPDEKVSISKSLLNDIKTILIACDAYDMGLIELMAEINKVLK